MSFLDQMPTQEELEKRAHVRGVFFALTQMLSQNRFSRALKEDVATVIQQAGITREEALRARVESHDFNDVAAACGWALLPERKG